MNKLLLKLLIISHFSLSSKHKPVKDLLIDESRIDCVTIKKDRNKVKGEPFTKRGNINVCIV